MYNGPLKVYVEGPGGATHPRFPFLVSQGRALIGTLQARSEAIDITSLTTSWTDEQGNTVKALHSPYIKKLFINVAAPVLQEREAEEGPQDELERETWVEVNRDFAEPIAAGDLLASRFARVTYETPSGELVRLLLDEEDESGTEGEGGPTPDVDWTERGADRQTATVDVNGTDVDTVVRAVYEAPTGDPNAPLLVSFTYATEEELPAPPAGAVQWDEMSRRVALILVGDTVEVDRTISVTFYRFVYYPNYRVLRMVEFLYEEGQDDYEWPDSITVIEPAGDN